jgi:hypothetical protein
MPRWLRTLLHLTPIVAAASAASVVGLLLFRGLIDVSDLGGSSNDLGNYLQTVGGIYAVLLAFVVYVVWGQFNEARGYVEREAAAVVDLHRVAGGLATATQKLIQDGLAAYLDAVLAEEWVAMAKRDEATVERVAQHLDRVWLAIHRHRPTDACEQQIYGEVLARYNEVADLRISRLTSARFRVPMNMRILLYAGAVIVVGSMYLIWIPKLWVHATVTGALAGAVAHVLYLIEDLDDAFDGHFQVDKTAYVRARRSLDRNKHLLDDAACA